jgi:hypothetical protein
MKVGDLVKVYKDTKPWRARCAAYFGEGTDDHMVGLIVSDTTMYRNWSIQLCKHNITYIFQEDRLEVMNESR